MINRSIESHREIQSIREKEETQHIIDSSTPPRHVHRSCSGATHVTRPVLWPRRPVTCAPCTGRGVGWSARPHICCRGRHPTALRDENGTEIFRTDRFRFLYYDTVFYIMIPFPNFAKHKNLSFSIGFTTIFCTL